MYLVTIHHWCVMQLQQQQIAHYKLIYIHLHCARE